MADFIAKWGWNVIGAFLIIFMVIMFLILGKSYEVVDFETRTNQFTERILMYAHANGAYESTDFTSEQIRKIIGGDEAKSASFSMRVQTIVFEDLIWEADVGSHQLRGYRIYQIDSGASRDPQITVFDGRVHEVTGTSIRDWEVDELYEAPDINGNEITLKLDEITSEKDLITLFERGINKDTTNLNEGVTKITVHTVGEPNPLIITTENKFRFKELYNLALTNPKDTSVDEEIYSLVAKSESTSKTHSKYVQGDERIYRLEIGLAADPRIVFYNGRVHETSWDSTVGEWVIGDLYTYPIWNSNSATSKLEYVTSEAELVRILEDYINKDSTGASGFVRVDIHRVNSGNEPVSITYVERNRLTLLRELLGKTPAEITAQQETQVAVNDAKPVLEEETSTITKGEYQYYAKETFKFQEPATKVPGKYYWRVSTRYVYLSDIQKNAKINFEYIYKN